MRVRHNGKGNRLSDWCSNCEESDADTDAKAMKSGVSVNDSAVRSIAQQNDMPKEPIASRLSPCTTARIQFLKIKVLVTLVK